MCLVDLNGRKLRYWGVIASLVSDWHIRQFNQKQFAQDSYQYKTCDFIAENTWEIRINRSKSGMVQWSNAELNHSCVWAKLSFV